MDLETLFSTYKDKTDKETTHSYGRMYDNWIGSKKRDYVEILLLGVNCFGGGDILVFDSFFDNCKITAIDLAFHNIPPEINFYTKLVGSAYDAKTYEAIKDSKFDIIIDDCLHDAKDQCLAFNLAYPLLKNRGRYIIEDIWSRNFSIVLAEIYKSKNNGIYTYHGPKRDPDNCIMVTK